MQKEQDATIEDAEADFHDGEELNFSHNSLSADKLEVLGDAVTASKARAISLNLSWCQIGPLECTTLGKVMARSSALAELHLCSNGIGAEGAQGLVPLLELGTSLRTLNLRFCDIDAAGCAALSEGVGRSAALAELHLFGNHIGDAGAQALGAALGSCASLTRLNLGCCKIGPAGCRALCEGVLSNAAIVDLSLMNNCFGDAGVRDLATMLSEHGAMTRVDLTANSISEHGATLLLQAVQRGPKRLSPLELRGVSLSNAATAVGLVGTGGGSDNASILSALNDRCSADNSLAMRLGWH